MNPKGWNLPDKTNLILEKIERITIPGLHSEISAEWWKLPKESPYLITANSPLENDHQDANALLSEQVMNLIIYKSPDDKILCYEYTRRLLRKRTRQILGITASYVCDLDDDGICETQLPALSEGTNGKLLLSILRIKLELSDEAELVKRIIRSAIREKNECGLKKSVAPAAKERKMPSY
jgi:hypothetical protein